MKDYLLLSHWNSEELSKLVNEKLKEGWELYEAPKCATARSTETRYHFQKPIEDVTTSSSTYCQAVTREATPTKP